MMLVLAIETSCDETAAALVEQTEARIVVRADVVHSQVERHAVFGGVVPEVASREHLDRIAPVVAEAMRGVALTELDAIAVTAGPGLIGALFVGVLYAKGLAYALGKPLIGVNHLAGHMAASSLLDAPPPRPHVALLVSGGHTALYLVSDAGVKTLGTTLDDAAGEAFDKTAKMLGIPYPGGAELSRTAQGGKRDAYALPIALPRKDSLDFSFSGLKTAVRTLLVAQPVTTPEAKRDLCAAIEGVIVEALVIKARRACERVGVKDLVLAGGVAANDFLRTRAAEELTKIGGKAHAPPKKWCTDNAAMIGAAALAQLQLSPQMPLQTGAGLDIAPKAYWPL